MNTPRKKPKRIATPEQIAVNKELGNRPRDFSLENVAKRSKKTLVNATTKAMPETIVRLLLKQYAVNKDITTLTATEATIFTKWLELLIRIYESKEKQPVEKKDAELNNWIQQLNKPKKEG